MTFLMAGADTTSATLAFCLFEIAQNPSVQDKLQKEIDAVLGDADIGNYIMMLSVYIHLGDHCMFTSTAGGLVWIALRGNAIGI